MKKLLSVLLMAALCTSAYAVTTFNSELAGKPLTATMSGADKVPVVQGSATKLITKNNLFAPFSTATQGKLDLKANDSAAVHKTGNETIYGVKTFPSGINADTSGNAATATVAANATNAGNADTVDSFHAVQGAGANQIPVLGPAGELPLNGDIVQGTSVVWRTTQSKYLAQNCQLVGGVWKYLAGGTASLYQIDYLGGLVFYTAPSGSAGATIAWNSNTVWHSGNDGAGSGQDADLLDGQQGSYYQPAGAQNTAAPYARHESGLRIIRGSIAANGTITAGSGFTVSLTGSTYTVTFTNAFTGTPTATATTIGAQNGNIQITSKSNSQVVFYTEAAAQDVSSAYAFDFIAIGPN